MMRAYNSFLVRCWLLDGDEQRIEIEHIQVGARTRVTSLAAAIAWIGARWHDVAPDRAGGPDEEEPAERL